MTDLPLDELAALPKQIMPGTVVLELGNKKNSTGLYRDWYLDQGLNYVCVDWNGLDGAWKFDMTQPDVWRYIIARNNTQTMNPFERFEVVTNFGFTEHVGETYAEQLECWRNVHELVAVGGYLSMCMPLMPWWKGHGRWMPDAGWYDEFAKENGYRIEVSKVWERVRKTYVCRFLKVLEKPFREPILMPIHRSDR